LKKALAERALKAELDHHLSGDESGNTRNCYGKKTVLTDAGALELAIPRDRAATFDPQLIGKYQRRFRGFDEKIISMYARGMSMREIAGHLRELYGLDVSADLDGYRRGDRGGHGVAEPTAGGHLCPGFPGCDPGEDPEREPGAQQGDPTWPSACAPMVPRKCSGYGSSRTRAPISDCGC
jgi:hypothetical protein